MASNFKIEDKEIVFFDGLCNLCSSSVNFILENEMCSKFYFSSLQSEFARKLLASHGIDSKVQNSIIFYSKSSLFYKSDAIIKISKNLKGFWKIFGVLIILPKFLRNFFYNIISKNRYKWFGKKEVCYIPKKDFSNRFIDA